MKLAGCECSKQRWEFIKENKKVRKQENTLSTKKYKKERKHALTQESDQEKTTTAKKKRKKTRSRPRKQPRKKKNFLSFFLTLKKGKRI